MKASEFDKIFDDNEETVLNLVDLASAKKVNRLPKRINIDFPTWMIEQLDDEANRLGVTRQSIIKVWIAERLQHRSTI